MLGPGGRRAVAPLEGFQLVFPPPHRSHDDMHAASAQAGGSNDCGGGVGA